ncbi:MAG: NAD(P)-dependent oxidoreductase [Candidatus Dojkabacteria bacterium]|nr:NAD(P)-dependent oxidoreductase [Candidatus Dojkabacteria bacterium]
MIPDHFKLKSTVKHPTTLIIGGLSKLGIEITEALLEQGGYVIIVDNYSEKEIKLAEIFKPGTMFSFVDFTMLPNLDEEIRRLDYVFCLIKDSINPLSKVTTQYFLNFSNYLDSSLTIASKFEAKFLLSTNIRSHQSLIDSTDKIIQNPRDWYYTNAEIERYAENLVLDYIERIDLDARIVRLGQIIGDGIDLAIESEFNNLIIAAAKGDPLILKKDGLEQEWLVHLLDAAYGVIKAQFSKDTKGQIFSIAYENPFTHLAIAYKIQEIEDGIQEIYFDNSHNYAAPLKIYQPAKNLATIGWMPRVPFDRALKQSIISAKIYLLENNQSGNNTNLSNEASFIEKVRSFISVVSKSKTNRINSSNNSNLDLDSLGPISKLMEERKRQEELRAKSIELANTSIKIKRRTKPKSVFEKFQDQLWNLTNSIGKKIDFLKNRTPLEFLFILFIAILIGLAYIFVFSPILVIAKGFLVIGSNANTLEISLYSNNFSVALDSINNICNEFESIQKSIDYLAKPMYLLSLDLHSKRYLKDIMVYINLCNVSRKLFTNLLTYEKYWASFRNNTQVRLSSENYLSVVNIGIDHSDLFNEMQHNIPFLKFYVQEVIDIVKQLETFELQYYPEFIASRIYELNERIKIFANKAYLFNYLEYFYNLLGFNEKKHYAIILVDNTRPMPIGGDILAVGVFSFLNGSITQSLVKSPYDINFDYSVISTSDLEEINLRRYSAVKLNNLRFADLASIEDKKTFFYIIFKIFSKTFNIKLDGLVILDLNFIQNTLEFLETNTNISKFELLGVNLFEANILSNFKLLVSSNENVLEKSRISSQLLASIFYEFLDNPKIIPMIFDNLVYNGLKDKTVVVFIKNRQYQKLLDSLYEDNLNTNFFISTGIIQNDPNFVNSDKFHSVIKSFVYRLDQDLKFNIKSNIKFISHQTYKEIYFCIPLLIQNSRINVRKVQSSQVTINTGKKEKCIVIMAPTESEIEVEIQDNMLNFANIDAQNYIISLLFTKSKGLLNSIDLDLTLSTSLPLSSISPAVTLQEGRTLFSLENVNNFTVKFSILK